MRQIININNQWKFTKCNEEQATQNSLIDKSWEDINIPHTWNAIDGANGVDFYKGACWYRKEFKVNSLTLGSKVFIEFNGSNSITDVYVNGNYIGQHRGGYSTFRFDITNVIEYGSNNILSVKVDNTVVDDVYPQKADFTFYGGIYRDVNIIITDNLHFDLMDYGSQGVYIGQEKVDHDSAVLKIKTRLKNEYEEDQKVRLWVKIIDSEGNDVTYSAQEVLLKALDTSEVELSAKILKPILWNGRKKPNLYKAIVSLIKHNDTTDELVIPIGIRFFHVDSEKGFFLNGDHFALNGVSRHQDRKNMGWAITKKEQIEDMELIKEIGATSIRLAHYQHSPYFYDLCDQEGMIVWAEIPFISVMSKEDLTGSNAKLQMLELIKQNYNHPSVIFWGLQNEIQIGGDRQEIKTVVKELNELTKKEDPYRLTTMANVTFVKNTDEYNYITDVLGFNKYFGWYSGKTEDMAQWLDDFHEINPQVKLSISEYGAEGIVEYHSDAPVVRDYSEEYHALYHETTWKIFMERPFLWGTYVWNMFDFGANIRDEGGVKGRNNKGLVTYDRKIKKDAFYLYKAFWSDEKFIYITGKRYVDRCADEIQIKLYSNCEKVSLLVNGKELETQEKNDRIFIFANVPLEKEWNEIRAMSKNDDGCWEDIAHFHKTAEQNEYYKAPGTGVGENVENWFVLPDLGEVIIEDLEITADVYSTQCTYREIIENEETKAIYRKYFGNRDEHPMFSMVLDMKIDTTAAQDNSEENKKRMYMLNRELTKIKKSK
ncbi:glycoside hydrolase family 2 TIM barrel-domain containing protein [Lacrimispora sp. 38-1]|uniref:glycoside hydrolase family 2 protein n=1 Tax=Lacrimispora sp. 38-1 TaxID=3125778 RepID=UPI003CFA7006